MDTLLETYFDFPGQTGKYFGKVRDVYYVGDDMVVVVATDRISAFDHILPAGIPYKGSILNTIAAQSLRATADICPNWFIDSTAARASVGYRCEPIRVEMVIRGYLTGHAWRTYESGLRTLCGVSLPEGMKEHDKFPEPIITPAVKSDKGHDEDISKEEILEKEILSEKDYNLMEKYTRALFQRGTEMAAARGLILVDTKYEFGTRDGKIMLIDEVHTPDSSRYFYADGYSERQAQGLPQRQLSKEFVREWLIENGFQGHPGESIPSMSDEWVETISNRYIELYEQLTGEKFDKERMRSVPEQVVDKTTRLLEKLKI